MTRYTKAFFGQEGNPHFDLAKAVEAYEWVLAHPDEAPFVVSKMLFDNTAFYMEANRDKIEPVVKSYIAKRLDEVRLGLSRRVSKSKAAGEALGVIEAISKAADDTDPPDPELSQRVKQQWRDNRGRFRTMNRTIVPSRTNKPLTGQTFGRAINGSPKVPGLKGEKLAAYQNDYMQVADAIKDAQRNLGEEAVVRAVYARGGVGPEMTVDAAAKTTLGAHDDLGLVPVSAYKDGDRVERVEAFSRQSSGAALGIDALTAMTGSPGFAQQAMGAAQAAPGALGDFTSRTAFDPDDIGTTEGMWRRLEASSKLANDLGGRYLPENAQLALKVGEWAGKYAPQAEKVIGPTARRSTYRYRGVEKEPNRTFQNEIDALRHEAKSGREAREWLIKGKPLERPLRTGDGTRIDRQPSKTIQAMQKLLPDPGLYELSRQSGTIPPSQGIIIDRTGKVVTEAVGYGEDWYLPFNLRNLSKLKGGEYIRTRAYGGLTTEDIYVGMVSGARAVTVVSHSGVYTLEFDDDFRGARRYNDKSGRMHARYAQLLDAVKGGDVTLGQPTPARQRELLETAAANTGLDPDLDWDNKELQNELKRLKVAERRKPTLAAADANREMLRAVNEKLINDGKYNGVPHFLQQQMTTGRITPEQAEDLMNDGQALAEMTGATREAMDAVRVATKVNEQNLNPLALNARGYEKALQALKEQFPYYIADAGMVSEGTIMGGRDSGYIKPRFNRPEAALEGFFDPTITGSGKIHADRTKYQNLSVVGTANNPRGPRQDRIFVDEKEAENRRKKGEPEDKPDAAPEGEQVGGAAPAAKPVSEGMKVAQDLVARNGLLAAAAWIQKQTTLGPNAKDGSGASAAGAPVGDKTKGYIGSDIYKDLNELKSALEREGRNGPTAAAIRAAMSKIESNSLFDVPPEIARGMSGDQMKAPKALPDSTLMILDGIGNEEFVFNDLKGKRTKEYFDEVIDKILRADPELRAVQNNDGEFALTPGATAASAGPAVAFLASRLTEEAIRWEQHKADPDLVPAPSVSELALKRKATSLAKLLQAYQARDKVAPPTPAEAAPKADAPMTGGDAADYAASLVDKARPFQDEVRSMTGMDKVADELDALVAQAIATRRREAAGMPVAERPMHMVFTGNPGVGKTTVARKIAPLYHELGLTSKNDFVDADPSQIKGEFSNQIREHTKQWLDEHKGGVIFVDEAHQLAHDEYGRQVLETMVPWSTNNRDTVIILAGYPEGMKRLFKTDPGLTSRFPKKVHFDDYDGQSLQSIGASMMADRAYSAPKPVQRAIDSALASLPTKMNADEFANGRSVETFINRMADAQEMRLLHVKDPSDKDLSTFTMTDVAHARKAMGLT